MDLDLQQKLQLGIKLARAGEVGKADLVFGQLLKASPDFEDALVWKAAVTEDRAEAVQCLKKVLQINPENRRAQAGLGWAQQRLAEEQSSPHSEAFRVFPAGTASPSSGQAVVRETLPPFQPPPSKAFSKPETKDQPAPYKKSRLTGKPPAIVLPPEALPPKPARSILRSKPAKVKTKISGTRKGKVAGSELLSAAAPQIELSVSENVGRNRPASYLNAKPVNLLWPLLLFVLALFLAMATFLLNTLSPVLGILALLAAFAGVFLFGRAEL